MGLKFPCTVESPKSLVINAEVGAPTSKIWIQEIRHGVGGRCSCITNVLYKILILKQMTMLWETKKNRRKISIKTSMLFFRIKYYRSQRYGKGDVGIVSLVPSLPSWANSRSEIQVSGLNGEDEEREKTLSVLYDQQVNTHMDTCILGDSSTEKTQNVT